MLADCGDVLQRADPQLGVGLIRQQLRRAIIYLIQCIPFANFPEFKGDARARFIGILFSALNLHELHRRLFDQHTNDE